MSAIFKREFKSYFNTMTGFIFLAVIFAFTGIFTTAINLRSQSASFEYVLGNITIRFMLIGPVLAMRSIAEERRSRTDQLLYSLPIKTIDTVLGKYLSMTAVLLIACVGMAFVPVILSLFGIVHYGSCYAALLGFFLLGAALIAICMFMSSLTESQIIENVSGVVSEMCASEQGLRRQLLSTRKDELTDKAYRAYGILKNARMLSSGEFMELVAYLKLGMAMDVIEFNDVKTLDKLIIDAQPANLVKIAKSYSLNADQRDLVRAALVRHTLENLK